MPKRAVSLGGSRADPSGDDGRLVACGPPQTILQKPRIMKNSRTAEYLKKYLERA
jgi:excinuclease UvrABC ATPase subunit